MRGLKRSSCRQISEPMLPPAPVTITVRPSIRRPMMFMSNCTGARRKRSLISMSRMGMRWSPPRRSWMGRMIFSSSPDCLQASIRFRKSRTGQGARRDQHGAGGAGGGDFANVFQPAQDRHLPQARTDGAVFHGQQAAHAIGQFAIGLHLAGQQARGVVGAHQQGPAEVARIEDRPELLAIQPPRAAQGAEHGDAAQAIHDNHTPRRCKSPNRGSTGPRRRRTSPPRNTAPGRSGRRKSRRSTSRRTGPQSGTR